MTDKIAHRLVALGLAASLIGCNSGGGNGNGNAAQAPPSDVDTVAHGVMVKGSAITNGVEYSLAGIPIIINDAPAADETELKNGMYVLIRGDVTGTTPNTKGFLDGVAKTIQAKHEVQGPVSTVGASSFVVLGQTVVVDSLTIFDPGPGIGSIAPNECVRVYGLRKVAINEVAASRVEEQPGPCTTTGEIKGIASNHLETPSCCSFDVAGLTIQYDPTVITNPVASPATDERVQNGEPIEVHFNPAGLPCATATPCTATAIDLEVVEDLQFFPDLDDRLELEGYVTTLAAPPNLDGDLFVLSGSIIVVAINASTEYVDAVGSPLSGLILSNGDWIEVEASPLLAGLWVADRIIFKLNVP